MRIFLPEDFWRNKRGLHFGKPVNYLKIGYHAGQDFYSDPIGEVTVVAPCDGVLKTFPFSKSAGWWGYYKFNYNGETYSLKLLHMYKQMRDGEYKEGDILGYCGATGLSITQKYGESYIGESHEKQISNKAVGHLHAELHKGEFQHDTNKIKALADERIIDPVTTFENWIANELQDNLVEEGKKPSGTSVVEASYKTKEVLTQLKPAYKTPSPKTEGLSLGNWLLSLLSYIFKKKK